MTDQPEARPARDEYVIERLLTSGRWLVETEDPAATAQQAEADAAWFMDSRSETTYRTVRRTITSVVIAVHPGCASKESR
ncbi:hypothetical protein QMK19_03365 [Streptomyces sp. H10-C2]|uniref:hypothetical protein n=1 Tax=unclassified Streptomyces TaxID=2593676 RepID=UPI0024BA8853|nr:MULTISPECIES: hypothetical protein [unclassified Streptomyces]MDJ0342225.1 hypothetical protein [Streptomyces sp. PH10-H1]MDJ0368739.1 hypothetical protein [Streptomyces sp. H10-C2]